MKCPNCGHESDSKFCPECGTKLDSESAGEFRPIRGSGIGNRFHTKMLSGQMTGEELVRHLQEIENCADQEHAQSYLKQLQEEQGQVMKERRYDGPFTTKLFGGTIEANNNSYRISCIAWAKGGGYAGNAGWYLALHETGKNEKQDYSNYEVITVS